MALRGDDWPMARISSEQRKLLTPVVGDGKLESSTAFTADQIGRALPRIKTETEPVVPGKKDLPQDIARYLDILGNTQRNTSLG